MTELLTESFCERCGTRYEFGSSEPMTRSQKTRGLMTGLRQFVMSTDSLQDSIDDAMRAEEETLAARQIDAFQEAFNFCFDCRRYTCTNCWNDEAGRCRSCVPVPGIDDMVGGDERPTNPIFMPTEAPETPLLATLEEPAWPAEEIPAPALEWPSEDDVVPPVAAEAATEAEQPAWPSEDEAPEPVAAEVEEPEPVAAEVEEPEPVAAEVEEPEPVAAEVEEPVEEPVAAEVEEPVEEPVAAEVDEPEPVVAEAQEPVEEPIAAAAETPEAEPEPITPIPPAAPRRDLRDTFARGPIVPRRPAEPVPESLAARRSQLDALGIDDPGQGTVHTGQRDTLPYRSSGAGSAANSTALAALWDASTRNLEASAQRASLRPCDACGLTVSSTARFCRRCGAPQTLSA
jgi:hypothetical protein